MVPAPAPPVRLALVPGRGPGVGMLRVVGLCGGLITVYGCLFVLLGPAETVLCVPFVAVLCCSYATFWGVCALMKHVYYARGILWWVDEDGEPTCRPAKLDVDRAIGDFVLELSCA